MVGVDYRNVNEVTLKDAHTMPRVDYYMYSLRGVKVFSKLDGKSDYHQIDMSS